MYSQFISLSDAPVLLQLSSFGGGSEDFTTHNALGSNYSSIY